LESNNGNPVKVVVLQLIEKDGWICEPVVGCGNKWHYTPNGPRYCPTCPLRSPDRTTRKNPATIHATKADAEGAAMQMANDLFLAQKAAQERQTALQNLQDMETAGIPANQGTGGDVTITTGANKRRRK